MSYTGPFPIIVADGGTEATNFSQNCLIVSGNGSIGEPLTNLSGGSTGEVLIGNTAAVPSWTNSPSVGGSITAATNVTATAGTVSAGTTVTGGTGVTATTGNVTASVGNLVATLGSVSAATTVTGGTGLTATTGNIAASAGNLALPTTSSTVGQITLNGTRWIQAFGSGNNFFGQSAGNFTLSSADNNGVGGSALSALTTGDGNTAMGNASLATVSSGAGNCALGRSALLSLTTGNGNIGIGNDFNTGNGVLNNLTTGSFNIAFGSLTGISYTSSESSNILISNSGVIGESNVIRIGSQGASDGQQNVCFIAGIRTATVANSAAVLIDQVTGQLGVVPSSARLKDNIKDMGSTQVMKLRPVTFNFKSDESKSKHFGLIAEEVHNIMPELVVYDDNKQPLSVQYHELPAILLNEIQKLTKRIEFLEKK